MTLVTVVVAILMLAGLVGAIVPLLPGAPLIFAGALVYAVATNFTPVGAGRLAILAAVGVLAWLLEHVAGAVGARSAGGGRAAVIGATVGLLVGVLVAPIGLLVGPIVGAIAGELLAGREPKASVRTGIGAALGVLTGVVAHFALALVMVGLFVWWVWQR
jgi:uncharacterized protein YqgC (DUF456 family)